MRFVLLLLAILVATPAEAKPHKAPESCFLLGCLKPAVEKISRDVVGPKPYAWCGWWMQIHTGITSAATKLNLNLAREWAKVGRPAQPGPGVIVVHPHHVERIIGPGSRPGTWKMISGNTGGTRGRRTVAVYEKPLRGVIALRAI